MKRIRAEQLVPLAIVVLLSAAETARVLGANESQFVYTLDDPYIHLALAENLARGHYGVNMEERSAPASSILWPFLLVPFGAAHLSPLFWNLLFACASALVLGAVVRAALEPDLGPRHPALPLLGGLLVVSTSVVNLAFTGMEHSAQVLAALLGVLGLVTEARTGRCPRWLPAVLVAGPFVRYENAALSVPALLLLAWRGHGRVAALSGAVLAAGIGVFSAWLAAQGLGWLPTSVVAKSPPIAEGTVASLLRNVSIGFAERQATPLALLGLASLAVALDPLRVRAERGLGAWGAGVVVAHFLAGRFGWYHRYEIYAWATLLSLNAILHGRLLAGALLRRATAGLAMFAATLFVLAFPYWHALYTLPVASNNIHEQQHQMHRFAVGYWKAPVAVNDLGWVSFRNDQYVLDLWGLASRRALEERRSSDRGDWMTELCASQNVKLAMIYEDWLAGVPSAWIPLADLRLSRNRTSVARSSMTFFALDEEARDRAIPLLEAFEKGLPRRVKLQRREGWRASAEP